MLMTRRFISLAAASVVLLQSRLIEGFAQWPKFPSFPASSSNAQKNVQLLEDELLDSIQQLDGRLSNSNKIVSLIDKLEQTPSIERPAVSPEIYGRWRLLYTTNADTSSPIQRKAVDTSKFPIYQDVLLQQEEQQLVVSQVVKFSDTSQLRVDALASTSAFPLPELTERKSTGKVFGLNILGVSFVGNEGKPDPNRPDSRIDFVFDYGEFDFFGKFQIPYPVPFRLPLFRDAVKGWIDVTYLSDRVRISRGNKGTTFVLVKEE